MKQALALAFSGILLVGFTAATFAQETAPAPAPTAPPAMQSAPPAADAPAEKKAPKKGHGKKKGHKKKGEAKQ